MEKYAKRAQKAENSKSILIEKCATLEKECSQTSQDFQKKLSTIELKYNNLKNEYYKIESQLKLCDKNHINKSDFELLSNDLKVVTNKLTNNEQSFNSLQNQHNILKNKISQLENDNNILLQSKNEMKTENDKLKQVNNQVNIEKNELLSNNEQLIKDNQQLTNDISQNETKFKESMLNLNNEYDDLVKQFTNNDQLSKSEISNLKDRLNTTNEYNDHLQIENEHLNKKINKNLDIIHKREKSIEKWKNKCKEIAMSSQEIMRDTRQLLQQQLQQKNDKNDKNDKNNKNKNKNKSKNEIENDNEIESSADKNKNNINDIDNINNRSIINNNITRLALLQSTIEKLSMTGKHISRISHDRDRDGNNGNENGNENENINRNMNDNGYLGIDGFDSEMELNNIDININQDFEFVPSSARLRKYNQDVISGISSDSSIDDGNDSNDSDSNGNGNDNEIDNDNDNNDNNSGDDNTDNIIVNRYSGDEIDDDIDANNENININTNSPSNSNSETQRNINQGKYVRNTKLERKIMNMSKFRKRLNFSKSKSKSKSKSRRVKRNNDNNNSTGDGIHFDNEINSIDIIEDSCEETDPEIGDEGSATPMYNQDDDDLDSDQSNPSDFDQLMPSC